MSEKMSKSSEQSLGGVSNPDNKVENKDESLKIKIDINLHQDDLMVAWDSKETEDGYLEINKDPMWLKLALWQAESQTRKFVEEKYPEVLTASEKLKKNEQKLINMLSPTSWEGNVHPIKSWDKSSTYNVKIAEMLYLENQGLYKKFFGNDSYPESHIMKRIRQLAKEDKK